MLKHLGVFRAKFDCLALSGDGIGEPALQMQGNGQAVQDGSVLVPGKIRCFQEIGQGVAVPFQLHPAADVVAKPEARRLGDGTISVGEGGAKLAVIETHLGAHGQGEAKVGKLGESLADDDVERRIAA